ncbi:hypothetical protein L931_01365 [Helicobacter pylori PZ5024]|uniref:Uncharacterized protein n=1 Tax=Helicobacter pylori PZ5024 TaxID=1337391 RepID=T2SSC1_HELPX|nr:hypothetical protein L931_01365 [Helicobacter pylori PZ5024]EQD97151.1 hypothetical protein L930_08945 [Helicobacter pylori PZ5004]
MYEYFNCFLKIAFYNFLSLLVNYPTAKAIGLFLASSLHN